MRTHREKNTLTIGLRVLALIALLISLGFPTASYVQTPKSVPDGHGPTRPKPEKAIALTSLPKDEALSADSDYELGSGWRLAISGKTDDKGRQTLIYYDRARVTQYATGYRAWIKYAHKENGDVQLDAMSLEDYDCKRHQVLTVEAKRYDDNGRVVDTTGVGSWANPTPDSLGEHVYSIFCRGERDKQWMDMVAAQHYFSFGRQDERKRLYKSALRWYEQALDYAPNHPKILAAIKRARDPLGIEPYLNPDFDELYSTPGVSPEVQEMAEVSRKARAATAPTVKRKPARRKIH